MQKYVAQEYEALFTDSQGDHGRVREDVGAYRVRTVRAGETVEVEAYPIWSTRVQAGRARAYVQKHREQVRRVHQRNRQKHLRRLINANFGAGDILLTLTYDAGMQPGDAGQAKRDVCNYLRRMRTLRARLGLPELKYVYTTEVTHGERGTRYHHHLIVNGGIPREAAEGLWRAGNVNSRAARPDGYGLSAWAHYMSKSREVQEKAGAHGFACSRNLKKPVITHADRKLSVKGVQRLAEDMRQQGARILEGAYPGYRLVEVQVRYSAFVTGAYIEARMAKKGSGTREA